MVQLMQELYHEPQGLGFRASGSTGQDSKDLFTQNLWGPKAILSAGLGDWRLWTVYIAVCLCSMAQPSSFCAAELSDVVLAHDLGESRRVLGTKKAHQPPFAPQARRDFDI